MSIDEGDALVAQDAPDERRAAVRLAFATLKPAHQTVLRMYYLESTSAREVAALLGLTKRAVEGRLFQARRALRKRLASDEPAQQTKQEAIR